MTGCAPDTPTGRKLTDPLLAELRAARPEPPPEVLSPRTAPNRALVEEIIMTATPTAAEQAETPTPARGASRRRFRLLAAAAAAVAVIVGLVVVAPWSGEDSAADALVRDSARATQAALADTGRATATAIVDGDRSRQAESLYEFAGDNERFVPAAGGYEFRIVDGQNYILGFEDRHPDQWYRVLCNAGVERSTPDPRTLVEALTPDADFEIVGEEEVDGVTTTHLRARNPGAVPAGVLAGEVLGEEVTAALDIWVDGDDVARRIDSTIEAPWQVTEWSVQFTDLGEDITIEAPAEFEDHDCNES